MSFRPRSRSSSCFWRAGKGDRAGNSVRFSDVLPTFGLVAAALGCVLLLGLSLGSFVSPGDVVADEAASVEMASDAALAASEIVTSCADCHEIDGPGYARNPHLALNRDPALAAHYGVTSSCTACHGDAEAHIEEGGADGTIFSFGPDEPASVKAERCLTCHQDAHPRFFATSHAQAGMDCTSCHAIHADGGPDLLIPPADSLQADLAREIGASSAACASCHGSELASFQLNERHRLHEGSMACVDCHNSHEPESRMLLGGFRQQACVDCHRDKGGPFVFEHGGQVVEGCVACHTPHGSVNRHMLKTQSVADLCYSCHASVPGFHTRFTSETVCTNCHVTIHGSNFHAGFLK